MLSQNAFGSRAASPSGNRAFIYEVAGMHQSDETDNNNFTIRNSGNVFIKVPFGSMNQEMQRITRMGGKIVKIHPL